MINKLDLPEDNTNPNNDSNPITSLSYTANTSTPKVYTADDIITELHNIKTINNVPIEPTTSEYKYGTVGYAEDNKKDLNLIRGLINTGGTSVISNPGNSNDFDFKYGVDDNPYAIRAEKQSNWTKAGASGLRLFTGTFGKIISGVGFLGGLAAAGGEGIYDLAGGDVKGQTYYNTILENPVVHGGEIIESYFQNLVPIYERESYINATATQRLFMADHWAKYSDGIQFMAAMMIDSYGIAALGIGSKVSTSMGRQILNIAKSDAKGIMKSLEAASALRQAGKLEEAAKIYSKLEQLTNISTGQKRLIDWTKKGVDFTTTHIMNTTQESLFEAKGNADQAGELYEGKINPETNEEYTIGEINERKRQVAYQSFGYNMAALAITNAPETFAVTSIFRNIKKSAFGSFIKNASKKAIKSELKHEVTKNVSKGLINRLKNMYSGTVAVKLAYAASAGLVTMGFESQEENVQLAITNTTIDGNPNWSKISQGMIDNFSTKEGQESMYLGAAIGFLPGSVAGYRNRSRNLIKKERQSILDNTVISMGIETPNLYITKTNDETGEVELVLDEKTKLPMVNSKVLEQLLNKYSKDTLADGLIAHSVTTDDMLLFEEAMKLKFADTIINPEFLLDNENITDSYLKDIVANIVLNNNAGMKAHRISSEKGFDEKEYDASIQDMITKMQEFAIQSNKAYNTISTFVDTIIPFSNNTKTNNKKQAIKNNMYQHSTLRSIYSKLNEFNNNEILKHNVDKVSQYDEAAYNTLMAINNDSAKTGFVAEVKEDINRRLKELRVKLNAKYKEKNILDKNGKLMRVNSDTKVLEITDNKTIKHLETIANKEVYTIEQIQHSILSAPIESTIDVLMKQYDDEEKENIKVAKEALKINGENEQKSLAELLSNIAMTEKGIFYDTRTNKELDAKYIKNLKQTAKNADATYGDKSIKAKFFNNTNTPFMDMFKKHMHKITLASKNNTTTVTKAIPISTKAIKTVNALKTHSIKVKLNDTETVYEITTDGKIIEARRQSNFVKYPSTTPEESNTELTNDKTGENREEIDNQFNLKRGNAIDYIGKNVLTDNKVTYQDLLDRGFNVFTDEKEFNKFIEFFEKVRIKILPKGGTIISDITIGTLNNGNPVAGETDILVIDKNGDVIIYDIKNIKNSTYRKTKVNDWKKQLSIYKVIIENVLGINVIGGQIITSEIKEIDVIPDGLTIPVQKIEFVTNTPETAIINIDINKAQKEIVNIAKDPADNPNKIVEKKIQSTDEITHLQASKHWITLLQARQSVFNRIMKQDFINKIAQFYALANPQDTSDEAKANAETLQPLLDFILHIVNNSVNIQGLNETSPEYTTLQRTLDDLPIYKSSFNVYFNNLFSALEAVKIKIDNGEPIENKNEEELRKVSISLHNFLDDSFDDKAEQYYSLIKDYLLDIEKDITIQSNTEYKIIPSLIQILKVSYNNIIEKITDTKNNKYKAMIKDSLVNYIINKKENITNDEQEDYAIIAAMFYEANQIKFSNYISSEEYIEAITAYFNTIKTALTNNIYITDFHFINQYIDRTIDSFNNEIAPINETLDDDINAFVDDFNEFNSNNNISKTESISVWLTLFHKSFKINNKNTYTTNSDGSITFNNTASADFYKALNQLNKSTPVEIEGNNIRVKINNEFVTIGVINNPKYLIAEISILQTLTNLVGTDEYKNVISLVNRINKYNYVPEHMYIKLYDTVMTMLNNNSNTFSTATGENSNIMEGLTPKEFLMVNTNTFKDSINGGRYLAEVLKREQVNPVYLSNYIKDYSFYKKLKNGEITAVEIASISTGSIENEINPDTKEYIRTPIKDILNVDSLLNGELDSFIGISQKNSTQITDLANNHGAYNGFGKSYNEQNLYLITRGLNGKLTPVAINRRKLNKKDAKLINDYINEITEYYKNNNIINPIEIRKIIDKINKYIPSSEKASKRNGALKYMSYNESTDTLTIDLRDGFIEVNFGAVTLYSVTFKDNNGNTKAPETNITKDNFLNKITPIIESGVINTDFARLKDEGKSYLKQLLEDGDLTISQANVYDTDGKTVIGKFHVEGTRPFTIRLKEKFESSPVEERDDNDTKTTIDNTDINFDFDSFEDNSTVNHLDIANSMAELNTINKVDANAWLLEKLGSTPKIKWFSNYLIKGNNLIQGSVLNRVLKLASYGVYGTEYHEAFHYIFNYLITNNEQQSIIDEGKEFYGTTNISKIIELLAEDYRAWEIVNEPKNIPSKIIKFFKEFLTRVNLIKNNTILISEFFNKISNSEYNNAKIINNNYTNTLITDFSSIPLPVQANSIAGFTSDERTSANRLLTQMHVDLQINDVNINLGKTDNNGNPLPPSYKRYDQITVGDLYNNPKLSAKSRLTNRFVQLAKEAQRSNTTTREQLLFLQKIFNNLKQADTNGNSIVQTLFNDVKRNLKKYYNTEFITDEELERLTTEDEYKLTRMFNDNAFKESTERNFKTITKYIIASGIEYTYDENGKAVQVIDRNTGLPKPIDYDLIYPKLQEYLKDIPNINHMQEVMQEIAEFYPTIQQYIDKIFIEDKSDEAKVNIVKTYTKINGEYKYTTVKISDSALNRRGAWFTDFNKTAIDEIGVLVPLNDVNYANNNIVKLNKNYENIIFATISNSISSFYNITTNIEDLDKIFMLSKNKANSDINIALDTKADIINSFKQLSSIDKNIILSSINSIINLAKSIGINQLDSNIIISYLNENNNKIIGGINVNSSITGKLAHLLNIIIKSKIEDNNINKSFTAIGNLATIISRYGNTQINYSYKDFNGNIKYGISKHNSISLFIAKLQNNTNREMVLNELLQMKTLADFKHSNLLTVDGKFSFLKKDENNNIILNEDNIAVFSLDLYSGIKKAYNNKVDNYLSQTELSWIYSKMALYAGNLKQSTNFQGVRTMLPILGDSTNHYLMTRNRIALSNDDIQFNKDNTITLLEKSKLYEAIVNTVKQDIGRINNAANIMFKNGKLKSNSILDELPLIEDYHYIIKNGKRVYINENGLTGNVFKFTNIDTIDINSHFLNGQLNVNDLMNKLPIYINDYINTKLSINKKLYGVLKDSFKYKFKDEKSKDNTMINSPYREHRFDNQYELLVIEQILNSYLNNVEMQLFFTGTNATQNSFAKVTKRAKKAIQFSERGSDIGTYNNLVVNDKFVNINNFVELYKTWIAKAMPNATTAERDAIIEPYTKSVQASDGWSLMTLNHWVRTMKHFGKWDDVKHLIEYKNGKYNIKKDLSVYELTNLIQVLKPIHVENKPHNIKVDGKDNYVMNYLYHKTSTFIPTELFSDTNSELDEIRKFMETNNIDNMIFKSGRKDGNVFTENLFDENNNLALHQININHVEQLQMQNFGLQLHVPDDIRDEKIKVGIQFYKHIIGNINDDAIYHVPGIKELDGKTGAALREMHMSAFVEVIIRDATKLYENLGGRIHEGMTELPLRNHNKFYNTFVDEAINRNYSPNDINSVTYQDVQDYIDNEQLDSIIITNDFSFGSNSTRSKALFTSLFTNGIINTKFSGGHLVLLSEALSNTSKTIHELTGATNEDVEYSKDLTTYEENGIIYVQAIMPAWSKSFFDIDGKLRDINTIDPEVLKMIGYRVPISSNHSAMVIKVVKFSEPTSGSVITLPAVLMTQTGWDFDVDSLFVMTKTHYISKDKIKVRKYNKSSLTYEKYIHNRINEIATNIPEINKLLATRYDLQGYIEDALIDLASNKAKLNNMPIELESALAAAEYINQLQLELNNTKDANKIKTIKDDIDSVRKSYILDNNMLKKVNDYSLYTYDNKELGKQLNEDIKSIQKINIELEHQLKKRNLLMSNNEFIKLKESNIDSILSRHQLQNKLIDIWSVLLSQHTGLAERLTTSSFNHNIEQRERINKIYKDETRKDIANLNPTNPEEQVKIRSAIIGGKAMLSIAANMDAVMTILENTTAELHTGIGIEYDTNDLQQGITLYGEENVKHNMIIHKQLGWTIDKSNKSMDGILINFNISEDVDHTVDSASDAMIRNINITTFPISVMLKGVGVKNSYIATFLNQYAINLLIDYENTSNRVTLGGNRANVLAEKHIYADIIDAAGLHTLFNYKDGKLMNDIPTIKKILKAKGINLPKINNIGLKESILNNMLHEQFHYYPDILNVDDSVDRLEYPAQDKIKFLINQLRVLAFYNNVDDISQKASSEIAHLNADKIHAGLSFEPYADLINAVEQDKLDNEGNIIPAAIMIGNTSMLKAIYKDDAYELLKAYYDYGVVVPFNTLRQFYSTQSDNIRNTLLEPFKNEFKEFNRNFNNNIKEFEAYIMFTMLSKFTLFNKPINDIYDIVGYNSHSSKNIYSRTLEYQDKPNNMKPSFIDMIVPKTYKDTGTKIFIELAKDISVDDLSIYQDSLSDMWDNGGKDREYVEDLILYAYIKDNFTFGANNITKLLSQSLLAKVGLTSVNNNTSGYTSKILIDTKTKELSLNYDIVVDEYLLNHYRTNNLIPKVTNKAKGKKVIDFGKKMRESDSFTVSRSNLELEMTDIQKARFIKHTYNITNGKNTIVFKKTKITDTDITYEKIDIKEYPLYMTKPINANNRNMFTEQNMTSVSNESVMHDFVDETFDAETYNLDDINNKKPC